MTSTPARAPDRAHTNLDPHLPALRAALEQQRQFRLEQLHELTGPAAAGHPAGDPQELIQRSLRAGAEAALADIQSALQRMDAGTYGRCVQCDAAIGLERLEFLHSAGLCMRCQHTRESSHR